MATPHFLMTKININIRRNINKTILYVAVIICFFSLLTTLPLFSSLRNYHCMYAGMWFPYNIFFIFSNAQKLLHLSLDDNLGWR